MISVEWFIIWLTVALFVGLILGSRMLKPHRVKHVDGYFDVSKSNPSQIYQLEVTTPPDLLKDQKNIVLQVRMLSEPPNS